MVGTLRLAHSTVSSSGLGSSLACPARHQVHGTPALTPRPGLAKSAAVTTAFDITVLPNGAARRPLVMAAAIIAAMTLLRIVYASAIELRTDEAYYWTWSQETALSFLDHPPGIAWLIRFGTAIFGDTTLGVRFGGIVAMLVMQLLLADIVRRLRRLPMMCAPSCSRC
ncbi:hypothetical protein ACVW0I_007259 [Bradyrhizobium sp. LM6.11]